MQKIKEKLFQLADKNYKEFHSSLCPGTDNIIGIRVPLLRSYAKIWNRRIIKYDR